MKTVLSFLAIALCVASVTAQTTNQTFQLRNGWNSIWLELEPSNTEIGAVFTNLPVSSVWTYVAKDSPVEFIQQQSEEQFNEPGWLAHLSRSRPDSFLSTLFSVHALRAYLVKVTNAATLTITGTPVVRPLKWVTDSFNLRGFPVNPAQLPTFATFFAPSSAHAGQAIYELQPNGQWQQVAPTASMKHGEAYWSFCSGASTFQGPTGIELDFGDGLHYGTVLTELLPRVINNSSSTRTVCWRELRSGANNPLSYQAFASNRLNWINLPSPHCYSIAGGEGNDLRLAIRRTAFAGNSYASLIEITDDIGTRYLVPVTAGKLLPARASLASSPGIGNPRAGLWIGSATVSNVNEVNSSQPTNLTPTRSTFDLRLLIHVDNNGQARLLKEVIQMWQNGTSTNDGRFVLLTDDTLIPQFQGASLRDGTPVGRRLSTASFDFEGGPTNALVMSGAFTTGDTNRCTIELEPNFATNPFKHRFHPDHDNLDARYASSREEAYEIIRNIELRYSPVDPAGQSNASLDYGYNVLGGVYRESISGLHRRSIEALGTFRLTRVSNTPVLNQ